MVFRKYLLWTFLLSLTYKVNVQFYIINLRVAICGEDMDGPWECDMRKSSP